MTPAGPLPRRHAGSRWYRFVLQAVGFDISDAESATRRLAHHHRPSMAAAGRLLSSSDQYMLLSRSSQRRAGFLVAGAAGNSR